MHLLLHLAIARVAVDVVHLRGVSLQVIQFPLVDVAIEVDELVARGAYAVVALHHVLGGEFVEVVVYRLAPRPAMFLSLQQGHERLALNVGRDGGSGHFEERGGVVDVLHHFIDGSASFVAVGQSHDERRVEAFLVHKALVEPAVLAHIESLVAGVDDERVCEHVVVAQVLHQPAHVLVEVLGHLGVVAHVALELEFGERAARGRILLEGLRQGVVELKVTRAVGRVKAVNVVQVVAAQACLVAGRVYLVVVGNVHVVG